MARRHARDGAKRRPRRGAVFSLAALAVIGAVGWMAPTIAVLTSLRDRPLVAALEGIAGSVSCGSARWAWLGPIEFRDVVLRDQAGRAAAIVPELVVERGLLALVFAPRNLGTVRLVGAEAVVEVRAEGSSLEDMFASWRSASDAGPPACTIEVVDGVVEFVDLPRGTAWRVGEIFLAVEVAGAEFVRDWTIGGRVRHAGQAIPAAPPRDALPADFRAEPRRLDRTTVAAGTAAALARDGGFSCTSAVTASGTRTVTVAAHRLPLGASSVVATRWSESHVLDGLAEVRLDVTLTDAEQRVAGSVETERLAVCRADTLAEVLSIDALEVPIELSVSDGHVAVTNLTAVSKLFRAEAAGRIRLPDTGAWHWVDGLAGDDFAVSADVDLAEVGRAFSGGLVVRDDVRVTDGHVEIMAASRADGAERVLEVRVAARDLAAEQSGGDAASGSRPLRWTEPFAGWLKARRGAAGGLRVDEARFTSGALEVTANGTEESATAQWTLDFGKLVAEAAEVVDLEGVRLTGLSRGRLELTRPTATGPTRATLAADLEDFEYAAAGRPVWRDEAVTVEAEAIGRVVGSTALLETASAVVTGGGDRLEATVAGGVAVDLAGLAQGTTPVRPGALNSTAAADVTLAGDLGRWHARLAALMPSLVAPGVAVSGRIEAVLAAIARGEAWEITRSGVEVERLEASVAGRRIVEPRLVASGVGVVQPLAGRVDVASAELLTATVSLRTAGLVWRPAGNTTAGGWRERLRGKVQWQADVGRLERWLVDPETAGRWPAAGRAWGTLELVDGADGLDVVLEAVGNQLAVAEGVAGAPTAPPRPVWAEPQATVTVECALPNRTPDTLRIDRIGLESSTLGIQARGIVGGLPRAFEIDGTLAYDWQQVSRLMAPWTGGALNFAGSGGRPFTIRGRLADPTSAGGASTPETTGTALPLPGEWVIASRGGAGTEAATTRAAVPVAARRPAADIFRTISLDTTVGWQAGVMAGFQVDAGEIPLRLLEGQLAFGPFDVGVAGGRVRGAPWLGLAAEPREVVVPAGRVVDRVSLAGVPSRRFASWLSPLIGHATHTTGLVSVDLAGARVPLADPFAGLAEARVTFDEFEVLPDAMLAPLAGLVAKLQALVDPRLALADKPVLMRVRSDPVTVRLVERRLWHEGLVLDAGQLTVKSAGSVASDGALAMVVEVALRGDVAGQTPVVARLLRTPLTIPLKGTVERPQFDARAIDMMLATIVENTAQAVIGDGIVRGLDALLGGQQPPPAQPAPLVLPPGR